MRLAPKLRWQVSDGNSMGQGAYCLLGYEHIRISYRDLALLIRDGRLTGDTKVIRDGEGFAAAVSCRAEFQRLLVRAPSRRE